MIFIMKRLVIAILAVLFATMQANAQKVGYIESQTILLQIPEYKTAQSKLELLSTQYKNEIETKYKQIETLYQSYQASKASMTASVRAQKESQIISMEQDVKALEKKYFGQDGNMQKKSQELLDPIKSIIGEAIEKVAQSGNYSIILDISAMQGVAYAKPADNLTSSVLAVLGY